MIVAAGADFPNRERYVVRVAIVVGVLWEMAVGDGNARVIERRLVSRHTRIGQRL
jgi:hypothetical protein